ncbi:MAG TPA: MaoC family dehydratase [Solirubrobacteraceae bacterium]|jgi:acyl dehydratase|nr:MaoC family dehydratase [Solirubrobacteraceae bacterium]
MTLTEASIPVAGPYYEDLEKGQVFAQAPSLTLTEGHQAVHQAILGDRLRLCLDRHLSGEVSGNPTPLAHPGLIWDVAIGQSTLPTGRVIGNLFYRGLVLRRWPRIGDTLHTTTEVVALRDNAPKPGRGPTGLAALRVLTVDQDDRPVLDYHRCAMLPMRNEDARPGHRDDLNLISAELEPTQLLDSVSQLDLARYRARIPGPHADAVEPGQRYSVETGDTVTGAPELVRLSLNLAAAHSDPTGSERERRLVYGGHTIGLAFQHVTRALPNLVTVTAWRSCDHLGPVFEGDVLHSTVSVQAKEGGPAATLVDLRVLTTATHEDGTTAEVLDWQPIGVMA